MSATTVPETSQTTGLADLPPLAVTTEGIPARERIAAPAEETQGHLPAGSLVPKPLRSRYWLVAGLPLMAIAVAVLWLFSGVSAYRSLDSAMTRSWIPSSVTVSVHAGDWYVYSEPWVPGTTVSVVGPDGSAVPVTQLDEPANYQADAVQIARFTVPAGGPQTQLYTVTTTNPLSTIASMAVGPNDLTGPWPAIALWVAGVSVLLSFVAALAIAVVPLERYRRQVAVLNAA